MLPAGHYRHYSSGTLSFLSITATNLKIWSIDEISRHSSIQRSTRYKNSNIGWGTDTVVPGKATRAPLTWHFVKIKLIQLYSTYKHAFKYCAMILLYISIQHGINITHWSRVTHRCVSTKDQHWFGLWLGAIRSLSATMLSYSSAGPWGTNVLNSIKIFFEEKCQPVCSDLKVLT